ncbi:hypothetical protein RFI_12534 [Reticulomyxa filosa]|uniref:Methyltransferase type 11 domain-containing protein n=1 Tax=Reticulomyxa filosa TaxID=46433 RepID=X6NFE0_RETFI|nr:hypothetical protein RFI_12534 [Reticulomyxa filosa]|eukprot:ETO24623.1 hypothetical protein RFI_12534 [Reticulomyxa filosa]
MEWYCTYKELCKAIQNQTNKTYVRIHKHWKKKKEMTEEMIKDGYLEVISMDVSNIVLERMTEKYFAAMANETRLHDPVACEYVTMDCTSIAFMDESMQCVIDKGTIDAIVSKVFGTKYFALHVQQILREYWRCLRWNGVVIFLSMYPEHILLETIQHSLDTFVVHAKWTIQHQMIRSVLFFFGVYTYFLFFFASALF